MKKMILASVLTLSSFAFASKWTIDPAHASARFAVKHLSVSTVRGTMGDVSGNVELNDADFTKSGPFTVAVDLKGINSGVEKRDGHLKSPDFFDVAKFPTMTFTSSKIEKGAVDAEGTTAVTLTGMLKIKDVSKEIVIKGLFAKEMQNPFSKAKTRGFSGTSKINRKDFALTWNVAVETGGFLVGDDVMIEVEAELVAEAAAPAPAKDAKDGKDAKGKK